MPTNPSKKVLAHWHFFNRSIANEEYPDYYQSEWLTPAGEGGVHLAYGGYLRDRPLFRNPIPLPFPDWRGRDYKDEMTMAQRMGVDGFLINSDLDHAATSPTALMLDAASALGTGFKIMLSFDAYALAATKTNQQIADYFNAFRGHASTMRHSDGQLIVSAFEPEVMSLARWQAIIGLIGEAVFFMPTFLDPAQYSTYSSILGGASLWWGNDYRQFVPGNGVENLRAACEADGVEFMSAAFPQDHRPYQQSYWEAWGSNNAVTALEYAVAHSGRYTQLITWNDYAEGHNWQPSARTQYGYADLARYYISWLKGGVQPAIERDVLYYFHRIEAPDAAGTGTEQTAPRFVNQLGAGEDHNDIELLAFLAAPGRIWIDGTYLDVDAGIQRLRIPFYVGTPVFKLTRSGVDVVSVTSAFPTRSASDYQDLLYRSGSSSRAAVPTP